MMELPTLESMSHIQVIESLAHLKDLLQALPHSLPVPPLMDSKYTSFLSFTLDPDIRKKTSCDVATLGEQLEAVFGYRAHTTGDGTIPIVECGMCIEAIHPILDMYYKKNPNNNVMKKWVVNIYQAALKVHSCEQVYGHLTLPHAHSHLRRQIYMILMQLLKGNDHPALMSYT
jgi:hypothetical protein